MQSKESWACEAGRYLGRLRRAMPMQVYIYVCWPLELSGNANLRLYQCWFAFTHRSPIKNFASCRLREKNFASLRLRKNLVELRARLSLLVDKTTFQYSALTIYYTTIGGDALDAPGSPPPAPQPWRKWTPWTRRIISQHPHAVGEWDALDALDHTTTSASRGGMGRHGRAGITTTSAARRGGSDALDAPDHPPAPARHGDAIGSPSSVRSPL